MSFPIVSALALTGGRVAHKDVSVALWVYVLFSLIAVAASVPYWGMLGHIG